MTLHCGAWSQTYKEHANETKIQHLASQEKKNLSALMHQRENLTKEMGMKCKIITLASCLIRTVYACHDQLKKSNWCFIRALGT